MEETAASEDFALSIFGLQEEMQTMRKQESVEDEEQWWIVLHAKVAVRPAPTTEGKPLCVLPQGSVVRAAKVERVSGVRWLALHSDELPKLAKPRRDGAAPAPPPHACMMIESATAGRLLMVAPKEFDWEELSSLPPRERGLAARARVLGAQMELSDADIGRLLEQADQRLQQQQQPRLGSQRAPLDTGTAALRLREAEDGLVDVSAAQPQAPATSVEIAPRSRYDEIALAHSAERRAERATELAAEAREQQQADGITRAREAARLARESQRAEALGEVGPLDEGSDGLRDPWPWRVAAGSEPEMLATQIRGGAPGKGPAFRRTS